MLNSFALLFGLSSLLLTQPIDDPVMKIKAERQARGESAPDGLRVVQPPPPLPPVESHVKDTRGYRAVRKARVKARKGRPTATSRTKGSTKANRKAPSKVVKKKSSRKR